MAIPNLTDKNFSVPLITWFTKNQRDLPWRKNRAPYFVLLSEIMLQQTRVETVIPYYERFVKRFPRLQDLAAAPEEEVYQLWEGLGYYSRARNLHRAAGYVVRDCHGEFPQTREKIHELPGVGPYTSGAIASLAFHLPEPAVDGNVVRVFSRLLARKMDAADPKLRQQLASRIVPLIPSGQAQAFNEGLMELGALICTPRNPRCLDCPVTKSCKARKTSDPAQFPGKKTAAKVRKERISLALIRSDKHVILQAPKAKGLLAGLWHFPQFSQIKPADLQKTLRRQFGISPIRLTSIKPFTHVFTHLKQEIHPRVARLDRRTPIPKPFAWVAIADLPQKPMPRAHRKLALAVLTERNFVAATTDK